MGVLAILSSADFALTCLVTRPLFANFACAVNFSEETGLESLLHAYM